MAASLLLLLAGVVLAWCGGSLFVDGAVGLARWARWPAAVVGVTVAAFGTSSPELMVAVQAALEGVPQISLGDVLGSNVVNISLVLALVVAASPMKTGDGLMRDWAWATALPPVMYAILRDGWFSRLDACILLALFAGWLAAVVRHARAHARAQPRDGSEGGRSLLRIAVMVVTGLALLIGAAQLVVHGGKGVAAALGWSWFIIGAVVVAVATGTPELATTIIAQLRGHHEVGLGNILGSNIFNALVIAAVAALIQPYSVNPQEVHPSLAIGLVSTLLILPGRRRTLGRWRGFALLGLYLVFVAVTLRAGEG